MMRNKNTKPVITAEIIENKILFIRGHKVMLDADLAAFYGVPTKVFNQAIKRNMRRFPADFMLRLTSKEGAAMRSQSVTASRRNIRHRPFAFTEQGIAMLSGVLNSARAIEVNIMIMRAFVRLREILSSNKELSRRLDELESKYDAQFKAVFDAIRGLMSSPEEPQKRIGFTAKEKHAKYLSAAH